MDQGQSPIEGDAAGAMVEAIGEPGQRRFRLVAMVDGTTCVIWMEKQQLQALGIALEQVLDQLDDVSVVVDGGQPPIVYDFDSREQFRAGRMELGYDERRDRLVIIAHDIEETTNNPRVTCRITREQARDLSADATVVVSAGRAICPLCMNPMGPGPHVCPGQNGHLPAHFDTDELEDES